MMKRAATLSVVFLAACGAESSNTGDLQTHINATTISGVYTEGDVVIDFAVVPVGDDAFEATFATDSFVYVGTFDANGVELEHELYIDDDDPSLPTGPARRQLGTYGVQDSHKVPGMSFHIDDDEPGVPDIVWRRPVGTYGIQDTPKTAPGMSFLDEDGPPLIPADSDRVALGNFGLVLGDVVEGGIRDPIPPSGEIVLPALASLEAHLATAELAR